MDVILRVRSIVNTVGSPVGEKKTNIEVDATDFHPKIAASIEGFSKKGRQLQSIESSTLLISA